MEKVTVEVLLKNIDANNKKLDRMDKQLADVNKRANKGVSSFKKLGIVIAGAYAVTRIVKFAGAMVKAYQTQVKAEAKVKQAILSTNSAAGKSFDELKAKAAALQKETLFGDEEILNGVTAQLLTFTNITNEEFDRTQQVALDLATVLDGDLKSASIQLGKALNDPVANLSALSRSGIQFSTEQKTLIKSLADTNQLAEAQNVILTELERQYGGQAEAAAKADGGITQLGNAFGDLKENVGGVILDFAGPFIEALTDVVGWMNELFESSDKMADVQKKFITKIVDEELHLNDLYDAINKTTIGTDERKKAIDDLNAAYPNLIHNINLEKASEDEVNKSRIQAIALIQAKIAAETKAAEIARITNEVDAEKRTITENLLDDMKLEDYARQKSLTAIQTYLTKVSKANSGFEEENIRVQRWKEKQLDNLSKDPILRFKEMQEINAREKERLKEISDSQQKVWGELQGQLRDTGVEYDKYIQVFGQLEKLERESRSDLRFTIDYYSTYENVVNELQLKVVELANAKGEESGETNKNH